MELPDGNVNGHSASGSVNGRSAEVILKNGKHLIEKLNQLSDREFREYIRKEYRIEYQQACDWVSAFERFGSRPDLIEDLPETAIRRLSSPSLDMADVEQIISDVHTGRIRGSCRSIDQAISECRKRRVLNGQQGKLNVSLSLGPELLSLLRTLEIRKSELEKANAISQEKIKEEQAAMDQRNIEIQNIESFLDFYEHTD